MQSSSRGGGPLGISGSRRRGRRTLPPGRVVAPDPDRWKTDYIDPGHNVARLTLFWVSNYAGSAYKIMDQLQLTMLMLAQHGIGLSLVPGFVKDEKFTIKWDINRPGTYDVLLLEAGDFSVLRDKAAELFDDQKYKPDPRPRLPVFFCEHNQGHGATRLKAPAGNSTSTWPPYVLISGASGCPRVAIVHEMCHAARNSIEHDDVESPEHPELRNFMRQGEPGTTMYKYQVLDLLAKPKGYFTGPPPPLKLG